MSPSRLGSSLCALLMLSCSGSSAYPPQAALTRDLDRRPFQAGLEPYHSTAEADFLDKSFFMPVSRFFAVAPGDHATNVNAHDEVPDSSWFENRVERSTVEAMAVGPCDEPPLDTRGPWRIVSGKPDGVYPGFVIEDARDRRYLLKLDGGLQGRHGSTADVVGSRIYFAAGFDVPCNQVVAFDRAVLTLAAGAEVQRANGDEGPMTWAHVDSSLAKGMRLPDGRWHGVASRYLPGRPLGPWSYHGTREGDRNDIVPHEDRRELRGSKLLAAWTGHWDAREQNTLAMWIETSKGQGYVRHHLLDFGDCFGALAGRTAVQVKRRGHVHWFDPEQVLVDFATLGLVERPWEGATLGPSGALFGYYDIERFDPETWSPSYPNPAFGRMLEHDAAWMARIIARFGPAELEALVGSARLERPLRDELVRLLSGRQRKILERYLARLSPLASPKIVEKASASWLCTDDLAVPAGVAGKRAYRARAWIGADGPELPRPPVEPADGGRLCARLPTAFGASARQPGYIVVEIATQQAPTLPYPARFHVYHFGEARYLLAGIERPEYFAPAN